MSFNLESSSNNEVNEVADDQVTSENLSETEDLSENYDDCALSEVRDESGNKVNSESLEEAEDDFEDCKKEMNELEEDNPELVDDDYFDDCGKEQEGYYVAEVTYVTDGEISDGEVDSELQEAYDECDDPEDMQQLKENANENEHVEVVKAEVIERPEDVSEDTGDIDGKFEEYEAAEEEYEQAQEHLEEQQKAAEEYEEKLYENIENENTDNEKINESEMVEEAASESFEEIEISDKEVNENIEENAEETEESVEEEPEENEEVLEDSEEVELDETDESVDENVESKENLTEDEIKENEDAVSESLEETEISDEEVKENIEEEAEKTEEVMGEKSEENEDVLENAEKVEPDEIDESVEENIDSKEALTEKSTKENEEDVSESLEETKTSDEETDEITEEKSSETELNEHIESSLEKEYLSYSEVDVLVKENAEELSALKEQKSNLETEMADKFDEVLSKERGTDDYKQTLQEYNALKDQKEELDEKYSAVSKQQETLENKSSELRDAQIAKGNEAISESVITLASAKALEEKFDTTYYETKPDVKAMELLSQENSALTKELSSEKDSIKSAMDAKMDEISKYVYSNNLDRYETSNDPYYQKLNSEYLAMKSAYDKVDYSIVKLDENNKLINEVLIDNGSEMAVRQFGHYQVDANGFVKGENHTQYMDVWNNYSDKANSVEYFEESKIVTVSPSSIEGVWLSDHDVSNPEDFWSQHEPDGTEQSFNEIASKIPDVKKELEKGKSLSEVMEDDDLSQCASIYFHPQNMPEVIKCGDHYEFQSNGRHRILAARNMGYDIPVKVVGERGYKNSKINAPTDYKFYDTEESSAFRNDAAELSNTYRSELKNDFKEVSVDDKAKLANDIMLEYNIEKVDFSDFDTEVAVSVCDAIKDAKTDFPDLDIKYIGSIDAQVRSIKNELTDFYREKLETIPNSGLTKEQINRIAEHNANKFVTNAKLNETNGTFAWSLNIPKVADPTKGGLSKYNGIAINGDYASDNAKFTAAKIKEVAIKHKPIGCDTPRATIDHELGHEIDKLLGANNDLEINRLYSEMIAKGDAENKLSGYSKKNVKEFIAECYSEYKNNPHPREYSTKIYQRLKYLYNQRKGN